MARTMIKSDKKSKILDQMLSKVKLDWMQCSQCKQTVLKNDCGICLKCQGKYERHNQPDSWENVTICDKCGGKTNDISSNSSDWTCDYCGLPIKKESIT